MPDLEPERRWIDPSQIQPGPIRHESLSKEVLVRATEVFDIIGPYLATTLEQFEINLMRDANGLLTRVVSPHPFAGRQVSAFATSATAHLFSLAESEER